MLPVSLNRRINISLLGCGIIVEDENDDEEGKDSTRFVHSNQVDRTAMLQAMTNSGHSVSSLATACNVEPSMISRLLREPRRNDPDESARNPSVGLAAKISSALSASPESLFPDIFDVTSNELGAQKNKRRERKTRKHLQRRSDHPDS